MRLNRHCARKGHKINIKGFINRILLPKAAGFFYFVVRCGIVLSPEVIRNLYMNGFSIPHFFLNFK